jgi:hypothetical protein
VTSLCSKNIAQQKWHARNQTQLKKEWADNDDLLHMLDESFRAPPTTRPDKTTTLLVNKRKQISRGRVENVGLQRQLEALQVHATEQLQSCDANLATANAGARLHVAPGEIRTIQKRLALAEGQFRIWI